MVKTIETVFKSGNSKTIIETPDGEYGWGGIYFTIRIKKPIKIKEIKVKPIKIK